MKEQLAKIEREALETITKAADPAALDELRVKYLGKKGELTAVLKQMGKLSAEERPAMGASTPRRATPPGTGRTPSTSTGTPG